MKAILISDHAKWCALMMNGKKTIEVRKTKALANAIQKLIDENGYADIYVYCSKSNYLGYISNRYVGKVIFKFRCYDVEVLFWDTDVIDKKLKGIHYIADEDFKKTCLTYEEYENYLDEGKDGYAIYISDLVIFDKPKELSEFRKPRCCDCKLRCNNNLEHSFCREVCSHNLDSERLSVCCDRDGWIKEYNTGNMCLTKAPQSWCYCEIVEKE